MEETDKQPERIKVYSCAFRVAIGIGDAEIILDPLQARVLAQVILAVSSECGGDANSSLMIEVEGAP